MESRELKQPSGGAFGKITAKLPKSPIASKPTPRTDMKTRTRSEHYRPTQPGRAAPSKSKSAEVPQRSYGKTPKSPTTPSDISKEPGLPSPSSGVPDARKIPSTSPGISKIPKRSERPTGAPSPRKSPPAHYQTPKTDPSVQPVQRKPPRTWGGRSGSPEMKPKSVPDTPSRLPAPPGAQSRPGRPGTPQKMPEVQRPQGGIPGGWDRPGGGPSLPGRGR